MVDSEKGIAKNADDQGELMLTLAQLCADLQIDPVRRQQAIFSIGAEASKDQQGQTFPQTMTGADFVSQVALLAQQIRPRPEQRWLLWLPDLHTFAVALFALWQAGRIPVLPPNFQPQMLAELGDAYDAVLHSASVVVPETQKLKWSVGILNVCVSGLSRCAEPAELCAPLQALDPAQCQLVLYTSGSTNRPKPVTKLLGQLDAEVQVLEQLWGTACATRPVLGTVPHHHIYGLLFRLLWPLASGRLSISVVAATPTELSCAWEQYGVCVLVSSPTHLSRLPELIDLPLWAGRYATIFSSGAPFPEAAARTLAQAWNRPVQEVYGSSETGGIAWRHAAQTHYPGWMPLPGIQISVSDEGTLELRSPFVSHGIADDVLHRTADKIMLAADGSFTLCGRIDRVVKIEGKRISLTYVEGQLQQHAWVQQAAVLVLDQARRQSLAAVIVLTPQGRERWEQARLSVSQELRRMLLQSMDAVLVPRRWRFVEAMPVDARGKLPLSHLQALFAPQTPAELALQSQA